MSTQTINLIKAHRILKHCDAVMGMHMDDFMLRPDVEELIGDDSNVFLTLSWTSEEGLGYHAEFNEELNATVLVDGSVMTLHDTEGDQHDMRILTFQDCLEFLDKLKEKS